LRTTLTTPRRPRANGRTGHGRAFFTVEQLRHAGEVLAPFLRRLASSPR
jgi:hypothetical protein